MSVLHYFNAVEFTRYVPAANGIAFDQRESFHSFSILNLVYRYDVGATF